MMAILSDGLVRIW